MAIKSDAEIYKILERHLKESKEPLSSSELWGFDDVRANARSAEKVSDYLGLMWRRGMLQRWNTPKTSMSRSLYAYSFKDPEDAHTHTPVVELKPLSAVPQTYKKSSVVITEEENRIVLDFDKFTMTIQAKG